jgi:maltose/maltodextrin transport system substrate-binding protein/arabinogalactan oligomer/maltooligosaccharide transport system substrate-binding protein
MRKAVVLCVMMLLMSISVAVPVFAQSGPDLLIWADNTRAPALAPLAEQFAADFGVTVEVQEIGMGDIRSNLPVAGPAGEGPDILIAAHDWIGELVLNGSVIPISLPSDIAADFSEASLRLFTYNGELYGMPYAVENVAFFRNPDLVPEAPVTWDEVKAITEQLVADGKSQFGFLPQGGDPYHFFPIMSAFGGYVFGLDKDGNYNPNDIGIDSPGAIASGEWLDSMVKGGFIPASLDYDTMLSNFETGKAAMIITGPWALPRLKQNGAKYAISPIPSGPAGPGRPFIGGQGFMISAYIDDNARLLAESFLIDFMAAEEPMRMLYNADPRPPAFLPLRESLDDADLSAFGEAGATGVPQPSIPQMTQVWGQWGGAIGFIIDQTLPPAEAMKSAANNIRTLIAGGEVAVAPVIVVGDTPPEDGPQAVSIPGTVQKAAGCKSDWSPDCANTQLAYTAESDVWIGSFALPAGEYEYKVALNNSWDENYGGMADRDGPNVKLSLTEDTTVTFVFDNKTKWVADSVNHVIASVPGSYQKAIGCSADWAPDCLRSWLQDPDGDGVYVFSTTSIPAGDYEAKVALNLSWDVNYGAEGVRDGANIAFNVPSDGTEVIFSFDSSTNILTITTG